MYADVKLVTGARELSVELRAVGTKVQRFGPIAVRSSAKDLRDAVRRHAQGRPGPEIRTKEYWNSIQYGSGTVGGGPYTSRVGRISRGFEASVWTDKPQARRLEFGFVGVDSLGRHYNQPPYPHWGPAVAEIQGIFFARVDGVVNSAFRGGKR